MNEAAKAEVFLNYSGLMKDKHLRRQFLNDLIIFSRQSDCKVARALKEFLNSRKIPKFRKAEAAPVAIIVKNIFDFPSYRPEPIKILALAWKKSKEELSESCSKFLHSVNESQLEEIRKTMDSEEECPAFEELTDGFTKEQADLDVSIVNLMMCLQICFWEQDEDDENGLIDDKLKPLSDLWKTCLEQLYDLDLDSKEWTEYDKFNEAVLSLKKDKNINDKNKKKIEKCQISIDEFVSKGNQLITDKSYIEYLGMNDCLSWIAERVSDEDIDTLSDSFEEFNEKFLNYIKIEQKTRERGKTRDEEKIRRKWISEMEALEEEIESLYNDLSSKLSDKSVTYREKAEDQEFATNETVELITEDVDINEKEALSIEFGADTASDILFHSPAEAILEISDTNKHEADVETEIALEDEIDSEETEEPEEATQIQEEFIHTLVTNDDLAAAYWMATSCENKKIDPVLPSWMFSALAGSRLIGWNTITLEGELLDITKNHSPLKNDATVLAAIGAALTPSLIAPSSGMVSWLGTPDFLGQINDLVEAVSRFAGRRYPLTPQDLSGVEGKEDHKAQMAEVKKEAASYMEEGKQRRISYGVAIRVWHHLIGEKGAIKRILQTVIDDDRTKKGQLERELGNWVQKEFVENKIKEIRKNRLGSTKDIVGPSRRHLQNLINQGLSLATRWLNLVDREKQLQDRSSWLMNEVIKLKKSAEDKYPELLPALMEFKLESNTLDLRIGAEVLGRSLIQFGNLLKINLDPEWELQFPLNLYRYTLNGCDTLHDLLWNRLVWFPELVFDDDYGPDDISPDKLMEIIDNSIKTSRTLNQTAKLWINKQDFRFVDSILENLPEDSDKEEFVDYFQENIEGSRESLRRAIDSAIESIEQAKIDGILLEEDRSDMLTIIEEIDLETERRISQKILRIQNEIELKISTARQERQKYLKDRWLQIKEALKASNKNDVLSTDIENFIEERFSRGDTRVAEECLSHLAEVSESGLEVNKDLFVSREKRTNETFLEFNNKLQDIERSLEKIRGLEGIHKLIDRRRHNETLNYKGLPKDRIESAKSAVLAFFKLKRNRDPENIKNAHISSILQFLGYRPFKGDKIEIDKKYETSDVLQATAKVTASNLARPVPEFGTLMEGAANILVLWERPVAETITSRIQELRLDKQGVILIFLGRLSAAQRMELLRLSRDQKLTIAILDESLLTYLTMQRGERLKAFLNCSLPFTTIVPYKPFEAGDIPPEMFYGRVEIAKELLPEVGTCLVYGGRQIGKSALLREVQRNYHNPSLNHYAWVEDIYSVGSPTSREAGRFREEIWERLREGLKKFHLLEKNITTNDPKRLKKHINSKIEQNPELRILLLFDEADNFLNADSSQDFPVIQDLKTLMADTRRHFKVVFTGLKTVQRFQGIPNQPFAQFGTPIQVGPLEPQDAFDLVREPLEAIGYEIDEPGILRILSYTNYQAGLIQFFCKKLIERMTKPASSDRISLPVKVKRSNVEAVYRDNDVREEIRQRMELTLELDKRYQAITWSIIVDQKAERDSYSRAYAASEILSMVRQNWPKGFKYYESDKMRSDLNEMCGLGVLIKDAKGYYRLKSPNMVRLMGTIEDIDNSLMELMNKNPEEQFSPNDYHTILSNITQNYSPLTYSQERDLTTPDFGVSIVSASPAISYDLISKSVEKLIPKELIDTSCGVLDEYPQNIRKPDAFFFHCDDLLKRSKKSKQIILTVKANCNAKTLQQLIETALTFCNKNRAKIKKRWMKIIFILNPEMTENWLNLEKTVIDDLENRCDAVLSPALWSEVGIRHRLQQLDKLSSPEVCEKIFDATGGWPILLDRLFSSAVNENNLASTAGEFKDKLLSEDSEIGSLFINAISLGSLKATPQVFNMFCKEKEIPEDLISDLNELMQTEDSEPLEQEDVLRSITYLKRLRIIESDEDIVKINQIIQAVYKVE